MSTPEKKRRGMPRRKAASYALGVLLGMSSLGGAYQFVVHQNREKGTYDLIHSYLNRVRATQPERRDSQLSNKPMEHMTGIELLEHSHEQNQFKEELELVQSTGMDNHKVELDFHRSEKKLWGGLSVVAGGVASFFAIWGYKTSGTEVYYQDEEKKAQEINELDDPKRMTWRQIIRHPITYLQNRRNSTLDIPKGIVESFPED